MIYLFELSHGKAVKKKVINQEEIYKFKTDNDLYWNQNCKELIIFEYKEEYSFQYPKFLDEDLMMIDNSKTLKLQNHKHAIKLKIYPQVTITQDENYAVFSTEDGNKDGLNHTITVYNISNASIEA